jgi:hypothetical protein
MKARCGPSQETFLRVAPEVSQPGHDPGVLMTSAKRSWPLLLLASCSSAGVFRRPREYQYELSPDGRGYTLYGVGADGRPGTADDVYPAQ